MESLDVLKARCGGRHADLSRLLSGESDALTHLREDKTMKKLVEEFVADIYAAYGSQNQGDDEIFAALNAEWPDLAITWCKALAALAEDESC